MKIDALIHAKYLLTGSGPLLFQHSIAVHQTKIWAILPTAEARKIYSAHSEFNLSQHLVMPGFINAHTHLSMNLLRGLADDVSVRSWLEDFIWPAEARWVSPEFVKEGALLAMAELIRGGVTCFNDSYFYVDHLVETVHSVGMRAVLAEPFFKFSTPCTPSADLAFERTQRLIDFCKHTDLIRPAVFPHAPYSTDLALLEKLSGFADQHHLLIHTHLLESQSEIEESLKIYGKRPIQLWHDLGLLGPKTVAAHMIHVNEADLEIVKNSGMHVVHCPESNMKLASGVCPAQAMLDQGISVALGTDGAASNNDLDFLGEMRSAAFLSKISTGSAESLSADTVLNMATIQGAKALNWGAEIGSLELGKAADMIALELETIETSPCFNLISQLVYAMPRHQVTHVWVNGKMLMDNRFLTTIDVESLLEKTKNWQGKLECFLAISKK